MANATLTAGFNVGTNVTSLSTTPMSDSAQVDEIVWVSLTYNNVEGFTTSAPVSVGDTTVHVDSQIAAQTHNVGDQVAPGHTLTAVGRSAAPMTIPRGRRL